MRAVISKSVMLSLALVAMTGCNTSSDQSTDQGSGKIQMNVNAQLPDGSTIDSVSYTLTCNTAGTKTGTWDVNSSTKHASGSIGGLPLTDSCSISIKGTSSWGTANGAPNNCSVSAAALTPSNVAAGTLATLNMTCNDGSSPVSATKSGHIEGVVTITATQTAYQCAGIGSDSAAPVEVVLGSSSALTSASSISTATVSTAWTADGSTTPFATTASASYTCTTLGMHTVTLSIADQKAGVQPACPAATDTIDISCVAGGAGGTGGATSTSTGGSSALPTGGTTATGGSSALPTGGTPATGGSSALPTGGTPATGGSSALPTGGTPATGGSSALPTGGAATGGTTAVVSEDLAILNAKSAACGTCAVQQCSNYLKDTYGTALDTANGFGSCFNTTVAALNQVQKISTYQAFDPYPITTAVAKNGTQVCLDVLACTIKSGCAAGGVGSVCFCGAAVGSDCIDSGNFADLAYFQSIGLSAVPGGYALDSSDAQVNGGAATSGMINGACFIENIDGRNTTSPSAVAAGFGSQTFALGPANQLVTCLANKSCTSCFN